MFMIFLKYPGIYPDLRSGMVATQEADRFLCQAWRLPTRDGAQPAVFHGSV